MVSTKKEFFVIVVLVGLSIFFSLWRASFRYEFNWDQEDDAIKVMGIIKNKKPVLIGPRVNNEDSFFTGPYHYYFLLPIYAVWGGNPRAGITALAIINVLTVVSFYWVGRKRWGKTAGIVAGVLAVINQGGTCWSAMYVSQPLLCLGLAECLGT